MRYLGVADSPMRIAVIGSGVSGLTCAWLLAGRHDVSVYEAADWIGGHTHTVDVTDHGASVAIDTGFIVFNHKTYPYFTRLLRELDVDSEHSTMSFSVKCEQSGLEYGGSNLATMFAQKRNLLSRRYWRFLFDISRFNQSVKAALTSADIDEAQTLGEFVEIEGFGADLRRHYLAPITAAIWSSGLQQALMIPFAFFARFFHNHGLLNLNDRPQWLVVAQGSRTYVQALIRDAQLQVHTETPVLALTRSPTSVSVTTERLGTQTYDAAIVATHSDQALAMLSQPSREETEVLGAIRYADSDVVLHTDKRLMPTARRAWSSWNYSLRHEEQTKPTLTYHMNTLQNLTCATDYFVSLNSDERIDPAREIARFRYAHPVFDLEALQARQRRAQINGVDRIWYCGAYWGNGFHEDGVASAVEVGRNIGADSARLNMLLANAS